MKILTHACEWIPDPRIARVRRRMLKMVDPDYGYTFALYRRHRPDPDIMLAPRVMGVVTASDSCTLTHAMIESLPSMLLLNSGPNGPALHRQAARVAAVKSEHGMSLAASFQRSSWVHRYHEGYNGSGQGQPWRSRW